jgi:CRISPR-associated endoribonuclease Cas6
MAAVFSSFRRIEPDLADILHSAPSPKPYTVSPIIASGVKDDHRGKYFLEVGSEVSIKISGIGQARSVLEALLTQLPRQLMLIDSAVAEVEGVETIRSVLLEDLLENAPNSSIARMRFRTPTAHRRADGNLELLPSPKVVFGGLQYKWRAFLGRPPEVDIEPVYVRSHRIKTVPIDFASHRMVGFIGSVDYAFPEKFAQGLWALVKLAEISGCGLKVTQGMGQVVAEPIGNCDDPLRYAPECSSGETPR